MGFKSRRYFYFRETSHVTIPIGMNRVDTNLFYI
jgi:hypothetical protein